MSTEIDDLKMRVASLEDEFRAVFGKAETIEPAPGSDAEHPPLGYRLAKVGDLRAPGYIWWDDDDENWETESCMRTGFPVKMGSGHIVANPIPANEGDSRLAESVAIPTECDHDWRYASRWTKPGFESCARCQKCDARKWDPTTPTEPARDLSAEVEKKAESLCIGCKRTLCGIDSRKTGGTVTHCANRMLCDSERIASLVLDKSRLTTGMMELRATVERLEAENAKLRKDRDQYRKELEELEAKLDGIKELAG